MPDLAFQKAIEAAGKGVVWDFLSLPPLLPELFPALPGCPAQPGVDDHKPPRLYCSSIPQGQPGAFAPARSNACLYKEV